MSQRESDVELQIATQEQAHHWFEVELDRLGLTPTQLDAQANAGAFVNERARRLWMASPNGIPTG